MTNNCDISSEINTLHNQNTLDVLSTINDESNLDSDITIKSETNYDADIESNTEGENIVDENIEEVNENTFNESVRPKLYSIISSNPELCNSSLRDDPRDIRKLIHADENSIPKRDSSKLNERSKNLIYLPDANLYSINDVEVPRRKVEEWKPNTTLIAGDSILFGIQEDRIKRDTKVRVFPGATIEDMHYYITPLLKRNPTNIILHIGTNNCTDDDASKVTSKIIHLVNYITSVLPNCKVILSSIITRFDSQKARITGSEDNR